MSKLVEILRESERTDLGSDERANPLLEKLDAHRKILLYTFLAIFVVSGVNYLDRLTTIILAGFG